MRDVTVIILKGSKTIRLKELEEETHADQNSRNIAGTTEAEIKPLERQ